MKTKIKIAFSVIFLAFPIFTFTNAVVAIGDMSAHKTGSAAVYLLAAVAVFAALVGVYAVLKRIANGKKISKIITPDLLLCGLQYRHARDPDLSYCSAGLQACS